MKLFHRDHDDVVDENIGHEYDDDDDDGGDDDVTCRQHVETQYQSTGDKIELLESQVSHSLSRFDTYHMSNRLQRQYLSQAMLLLLLLRL